MTETLPKQLEIAFSRIRTYIELSIEAKPVPPRDAQPWPETIEHLRDRFALSAFECDILLLCAAVELNGEFAQLCERANGSGAFPTFGLALAAFPQADWRTIAPTGALRYWNLVDVGKTRTLPEASLTLDETILNLIVGTRHLDHRLIPATIPVPSGAIAPSQARFASEIVGTMESHGTYRVTVQLCGADAVTKRAIANEAARIAQMGLIGIDASAVLNEPPGSLIERLWQREAILGMGCLFIDAERLEPADHLSWSSLARFIDRIDVPVIVACGLQHHLGIRPTVAMTVSRPTRAEQRSMWQRVIANPSLATIADELAYQFDFSSEQIELAWRTTIARIAGSAQGDAHQLETVHESIWETAREYARVNLDELAARIVPKASWDDLIVSGETRSLLAAIALQVRHRSAVYDQWGVGGRSTRGLGIAALFSGGSGTGKTLAAEVLARDLHMDLYRVDLSAMVSKYIGETEKNLRRIFDAAESAGAVLLFDEADALFGKRSEVKESNDRFANIEVSYLLQRMEEYSGLAILTTNLKSNVDTAFLRRLRFVVDFSFPARAEREQIWRRALLGIPNKDLRFERLAELNVAGGDIRNIVLNAAFNAAARNGSVETADVLAATRIEFSKLERPLTAAEMRAFA